MRAYAMGKRPRYGNDIQDEQKKSKKKRRIAQ
jgi:hypothetical protein